jgi:hypothetical protein
MKLNLVDRQILKYILIVTIVAAVVMLFAAPAKSMYQPKPVKVETVSEGSMFDLPKSTDCLNTSPYSGSTGGVCDSQKLVKDQSSYKLVE